MDTQVSRVRTAYDRDPEREWGRLESGAQDRLEYLITTHALTRHLPPLDRPRHVLDAGGGPGRYTIDLARRGYRVTLLDLSPGLLALARKRIGMFAPSTQANVAAVVADSIVDLSRFPDDSFDAVLCLGGPLSHVIDPNGRRQAVRELARVAKPGAPLFISVMNLIGVFRGMVQWQDYDRTPMGQFWGTGLSYIVINEQPVPTYFFTPDGFTALVEDQGLAVERVYGCSGIGARLQEENLLALMDDPERWPMWRRVLLDTCDHPSVVGVSRSLLAVAKKRPPTG